MCIYMYIVTTNSINMHETSEKLKYCYLVSKNENRTENEINSKIK